MSAEKKPTAASFVAALPLPLGQGVKPSGTPRSFSGETTRILLSLFRMLLYAVRPFNPAPEAPALPPEVPWWLDEEEALQLCRDAFERIEQTREFLEVKARATFSICAILVPLIISAGEFVLVRPATRSWLTMALAYTSGFLTLLSFLSAARAAAVQERQDMALESIADPALNCFRRDGAASKARGFLYCSSINSAMNAHIAQLVKGAQVLGALAVILLTATALSAAVAAANSQPTPVLTKAAEPVPVQPISVRVDEAQFRQLLEQFETTAANEQALSRQNQVLENRIEELERAARRSRRLPVGKSGAMTAQPGRD